jgi:hypothetical protein
LEFRIAVFLTLEVQYRDKTAGLRKNKPIVS